jgi:tRNA(Ile)-lysidine synthase TilS/MesJ
MGESVQRCVRCVLPEGYPGATFDSEGVCTYCRIFENRWKDYRPRNREDEFINLFRRADGNGFQKALVGLSGGKDSCYTLHMMAKYGIPVIAYTYDNGFLSEGARDNIDRFVQRLEHRYVSVGDEVNRQVYRALLKNGCSDFCMPCANGALAQAFELARKENVGFIVWGLSPRTEPILPLEMLNAYDFRFMADAVRSNGATPNLRPFANCGLMKAFYLTFIKRLRIVFLPEYIEWNEDEICRLLQEEYGWVDYGKGKPHFDCVANRAVDYFMYRRLGVSKGAEKLSVMVRCGQLSRSEALEALAREEITEEPRESVDAICERLGLTRDDLAPLLEGSAKDYTQFRSYASLFRALSGVFWLTFKMGFTSESLYQKYRRHTFAPPAETAEAPERQPTVVP